MSVPGSVAGVTLSSPLKKCANPSCGKVESTALKLQRCSLCKIEYYCGENCQSSRWPTHKIVCAGKVESKGSDKSSAGVASSKVGAGATAEKVKSYAGAVPIDRSHSDYDKIMAAADANRKKNAAKIQEIEALQKKLLDSLPKPQVSPKPKSETQEKWSAELGWDNDDFKDDFKGIGDSTLVSEIKKARALPMGLRDMAVYDVAIKMMQKGHVVRACKLISGEVILMPVRIKFFEQALVELLKDEKEVEKTIWIGERLLEPKQLYRSIVSCLAGKGFIKKACEVARTADLKESSLLLEVIASSLMNQRKYPEARGVALTIPDRGRQADLMEMIARHL